MTSRLPTSRRTQLFRTARITLSIALALAAGVLAFSAFATAARNVGPISVTLDLTPTLGGGTTLAFPPFGTITADTHAGPMAVSVRLDGVDVHALEEVATEGMLGQADVDGWTSAAIRTVAVATVRGVLAALIAAALTAFALTRSRTLTAWVTAIMLVACVTPVALGVTTFDAMAFREPTFNGALSYAPGAIQLVQDRITNIEGLQRQVRSLATDLAAYYGVDQSFTGAGTLPDTYRVLHVSDLHLDPVGMQLTMDLASAYDAELVIDTGDISHFGTEQEAALATAQMGQRPYVYIPGNHDTPELIAHFREYGLTVLDNETTTTARGLVILGVGDPTSVDASVEPDSARAREYGREVAESRADESFDIVAVHDPASGVSFIARTPIVLSGHTHTASYSVEDGTILLGSSTTGGVHFTELSSDPHIPHSASVLYFSLSEPGRLVAIDQIEVYGKTRQSSIRRTVVDPDLLEPTDGEG